MTYCYYHNDLDGKCAAFIVGLKHSDVKYVPVDYDRYEIKPVGKKDMVYIVDFSFPLEVMQRLMAKTQNIIWIDHHVSAIKKLEPIADELKGIRDTSMAGCELTWKYFHDNEQAYEFVRLIGDYDTWKFKYLCTEAFNFGMLLYSTEPDKPIWKELYGNEKTVYRVKEEGNICIQFRDQAVQEAYKSMFGMKWLGFNCLVSTLGLWGSKGFPKDIQKDYDILVTCYYNGDEWSILLYSTTVDVATICEQYGGGGHPGAAGFQSHLPPWELDEVVR